MPPKFRGHPAIAPPNYGLGDKDTRFRGRSKSRSGSEPVTPSPFPKHEGWTTIPAALQSTSWVVPVPSNVQINDIIEIVVYRETSAAVTSSGFTQKIQIANTDHWLTVLWKRASAADTGTYTISATGNTFTDTWVRRISGAITSGDPYDTSDDAAKTTLSNTTDLVVLTTTVPNTLLSYYACSFQGGDWTAPDGMSMYAFTGGKMMASQEWPNAATTSNYVASVTGATGRTTAWIGAIKPVPPPAGSATVTVTANDATSLVSSGAGNAAVTVTANNAAINIQPNAGNATVTVTANNATGDVKPGAGNAAVTVTANNAGGSVKTNASLATVTVTANNAAINIQPNAGNAAVTVTANNTTSKVSTGAGLAVVTVTANNPAPNMQPNAGLATVTVTANNATVSSAAFTNANAGNAAVTVTANDTTSKVSTGAGLATVTATANAASTSVKTNAGLATVTVTSLQAAGNVQPNAGLATVSVTANGAAPSVKASAGFGAVSVTANGASIPTTGSTMAANAAVTVTAFNATIHIANADLIVIEGYGGGSVSINYLSGAGSRIEGG